MDAIASLFIKQRAIPLSVEEKRERKRKLNKAYQNRPEIKERLKEYNANRYIEQQVRSVMDDLLDAVVMNACLEDC